MPRKLVRQEPPPSEDPLGDAAAEAWCDALLVEGGDRAATHRAHIRALNAARQAAERATASRQRRSDGQPAAEDDSAGA